MGITCGLRKNILGGIHKLWFCFHLVDGLALPLTPLCYLFPPTALVASQAYPVVEPLN